MPQEKLNWDTSAVFLDNRYHTEETWQDEEGNPLHPQQSYFVGGQTKVYGAALFRMRAEDFGVIQHKGRISPAWPISYSDMEPYYTRAEELFHVHGKLRRQEPKEDKARDEAGTRFSDPTPPLLITFQQDTGKLPRGFPIQLPHDTAIAAIHRGRTVALPVGSFDAVPDLVVDDENLEHAGLEFAVA
jgi:choline dehydrogenase-like flavoprotein